MLVPVLLFIVGLLFLIKGGDWFVDGASALARRFHLPELLIGATVVSIGTTLPEVMVSTMSAPLARRSSVISLGILSSSGEAKIIRLPNCCMK